jgi:hypothetical protein
VPFELTRAKAQDCEPKEEEKLHPEQSKFSKIPIQVESSLSELSGTSESQQSLFSLLLEIESRLRKEFRNDEVERRLKPPNSRSRYCE